MNSKQEIVDAMDGVPSDGCPPPAVFTQTATVGQMGACGASWPDAHFDSVLMERLSLQFPKQFGFACARVPFCLTVEVEGLGAELKMGSSDTQPSVIGSRFRGLEGFDMPLDDLPDPEEFASTGRRAMIAQVAEKVSRENPDLFVTAGMFDPVSVAMQTLGAESFLIGYMMNPSRAVEWVAAMVPYSMAYGSRLSESADNVTVITNASTDILDPELYRIASEPHLPKVISVLKNSFSTVHACGDTLERADRIAASGATALSLEASHDPEAYLEKVGGRCRMVGSVDPIRVLLEGQPLDVTASARRYAELGFDVITPECGVPPRTSDENLYALAHYRD